MSSICTASEADIAIIVAAVEVIVIVMADSVRKMIMIVIVNGGGTSMDGRCQERRTDGGIGVTVFR